MARTRANGIDIEYEALGDPSHPAMLLVMGLGAQLIHWPDAFCHGRVPTLVLHGEDDALLPQEHGRDTAMLVPGSEIEVYPGWGHDIPRGLIPTLVERIARFCSAAG